MPSHSILPEARRAAIEAAFDEALAEVRASGNVALLQECRAIFRKRVPLTLRAYVAAALVLKGAGASRPADRRGRSADSGKDSRGARDNRPGNDRQKEGRPQKEAQPVSAQKKTEKPRKEPSVREVRTVAEASEIREPREIRENRYRGEGVTLFVSAGRRQRFYARVAIKVLLDIPGVTDEVVGDIRTMDNYSFIVVDPAIEDAVIAGLNGYDFKGRILAANRARKRGESAPSLEEGSELRAADKVSSSYESSDELRDESNDSFESSDDDGVELEAFGSGSDDDHLAEESYGVDDDSEDEPTEDA
ncbi:MAG: hypothetical protein A2Y38_06160 [Spirochaetes bacterium GWB1_59_5]|nr:MAG: hypothetical protein A2Y38_06160 [Spirochaetes bacterium GWB1_59_5]